MADLCDYLRWRGDLSFSERAMNDVDVCCLAALVSLDLAGIVPTIGAGTSVRLEVALAQLLERAEGTIEPFVRTLAAIDDELVALMQGARRYADIRLHSFVDMADEERSLQFSALVAEVEDTATCVCFRGTDDSLSGWRENFMASYRITAAQLEAARYLRRVAKATAPDAPLIVLGHSKGGNLAAYAAASAPEAVRERIRAVWSLEGPGLAPIVPESLHERLEGCLHHVVCDDSVVGLLFTGEDAPLEVVASSERGLLAHDLTTWEVGPDGLVAGELTDGSLALRRTMDRWCSDVAPWEQERVVGEVFDALEDAGISRVTDIVRSPDQTLRAIAALTTLDARTFEVIRAFLQEALGTSLDAIASTLKRQLRRRRRQEGEPKD